MHTWLTPIEKNCNAWVRFLHRLNVVFLIERFAVPALFRKWKACLDQVADSEDYYQKLCQRVGPNLVRQYTIQEAEMQKKRDVDVTVMDAMDVQNDRGK